MKTRILASERSEQQAMQSKAKQSKAKQSKAKQSKAKQSELVTTSVQTRIRANTNLLTPSSLDAANKM